MSDTSLSGLADFLDAEPEQHIEILRSYTGNALTLMYKWLKQETPVDTGALRDDLSCYGEGSGLVLSTPEAAQSVMKHWQLGQEVGIISDLDYSKPIYLDGHSPKFPSGKLDLGLEASLQTAFEAALSNK